MPPSADDWVKEVLSVVDPRSRGDVERDYEEARGAPGLRVPAERIVLVGHRASGKTRLLPVIAGRLGRTAVDLDQEIERRAGKKIRDWLPADPEGFRRAEREAFDATTASSVVAAGAGFLFHHPEALRDSAVVWIPVSYETYLERLREDTERPRLRPELSLEEEIETVYREREQGRTAFATWPLGLFLAAVAAGTP